MNLEHSKSAYWADFAFFGLVILALSGYLVDYSAAGDWATGISLALTCGVGLGSWSLIEYLLHRFVLHGLQPFRRWHLEHHNRPTALIGAPTVLSSGLIFAMVFLPGWGFLGLQHAAALTLGVLLGYLTYATIHHAVHHWHPSSPWISRRKRWHALHHHSLCARSPGRYGVSTSMWDYVFSTLPAKRATSEREG